MPLKNYGVLKGRPIDRRLATSRNAHYQIHMVDDAGVQYRIAVNVFSKLKPSEVEYVVDEAFAHPVTDGLAELKSGWKELPRKPDGLALDFIRGNLLDRTAMRPLPFAVPGPDNDLNEKLDRLITRALSDEDAELYAFGERWGPENNKADKFFGFVPGNGVHDIHMNQGNHSSFAHTDGVYQDGALLIHFPNERQWVAVFLKFQSQAWHTDDKTGRRTADPGPGMDEGERPGEGRGEGEVPGAFPGEPDHLVRIVAAMVNPRNVGGKPEQETVTLLNTTPDEIDLAGWAVGNKAKQWHKLGGKLAGRGTVTVALPPAVPLSNKGGIITLLNPQKLKVDGVSYTAADARREGWAIKF